MNVLNENDGFNLLMEIVRLGRSEKPYKHLLVELKPYVENFPSLQSLIQSIK